jgi:Putative Ig domain
MPSKFRTHCLGFLLIAAFAHAQQTSSDRLTISEKEVPPKISLWQSYSYRLRASGGAESYHWRLATGSLPRGMQLTDSGEISGVTEDVGSFEFTALVTDNGNPPNQAQGKFVLSIETPLTAEWQHVAEVNGQRIDGSIKISNRTGRDFDLTVIVLAVNDNGRATAIGYQHFPLKRNIRDFDIPFGETLSRGNYTVNVEVVGEELVSQRIFRARLVSQKEPVNFGP